MDPIINFLVGPFLVWLPKVVIYLLFVGAILLYINREKGIPGLKFLNSKFLVLSTVSFRLFYALILSVTQYYVWTQSKFTQLLLDSPVDKTVPQDGIIAVFPWLFETKLGYFFLYSWGRFWLSVLLTILVSYFFWLFLKALKKHKDRFFDTGEVELGLLISLLVGWPGFVIFVPFVFVFVVFVSIFRGIFLKEAYTTLGWPFIFGGAVAILAGGYLINLLNLGVLKI